MTQAEAKQYPNGLYRLYWKSGGVSQAAVGTLYDGRRWFAPVNWTSKTTGGIASNKWRDVEYIEAAD